MRFLSLSLVLVSMMLLFLNTQALANEYKFMCKNMFWVNQLMVLDAKTEDEARFKLKHDRKFKGYTNCAFQSMKTDEQLKRSGNQDTWGKRLINKVDNALQTPIAPAEPPQ